MSSGALSSAALSAVQPSLNSSTTSFQHSPGAESKSPSTGPSQVVYDRNWEVEMEGLLKVCRWALFKNMFGIRLSDSVDLGHVWGYQESTDPATDRYGLFFDLFFVTLIQGLV